MAADVYVGQPKACDRVKHDYRSANGPVICTENSYHPGADACQGDSGGPLTIEKGGRRYLAGILSYGANPEGNPTCALPDGFGIYTHAHQYADWLRDVVGTVPSGS
ncbi:hypothetical protein GCM10010339_69080 [Streptomyces alanosinicus]|uniref:Peptidase S1 domain-containing protein n=2 Tax=Streptomyces alanosinicus TaxID=68171 RepID=A0A918YQ77_9ACTN|nr:hypothetical protein GCM10010339_69080 [Streptomyces alanosinicus]